MLDLQPAPRVTKSTVTAESALWHAAYSLHATTPARGRHHGPAPRTQPHTPQVPRRPVSTSSSTDTEYEVESIIAVAMVRGHPKYLIRWAGYDSTHDTYEPECNLRGCQDLLDAFKARHRAAMRRIACRRVRAQQRGTLLAYFKPT